MYFIIDIYYPHLIQTQNPTPKTEDKDIVQYIVYLVIISYQGAYDQLMMFVKYD